MPVLPACGRRYAEVSDILHCLTRIAPKAVDPGSWLRGVAPRAGKGAVSRGSALRLCARRPHSLPLLPPDLAGQAGLQELHPFRNL